MTRPRPALPLLLTLLSLLGGGASHAWLHADGHGAPDAGRASPAGHAEVHDGGCPHAPDDGHADAPHCTQCKLAHAHKIAAPSGAVALAPPEAASRPHAHGPAAAISALSGGVLGARGPPAITG